jgi:hypothetical protein
LSKAQSDKSKRLESNVIPLAPEVLGRVVRDRLAPRHCGDIVTR